MDEGLKKNGKNKMEHLYLINGGLLIQS